MTKSNISRRRFIEGGAGLTIANLVPGTTRIALAASMEERTVGAAKTVGAADVSGMIWSPYLVPMQPVIAEFKKQTGIGVGGVQDISIFDAPQRAMAEALDVLWSKLRGLVPARRRLCRQDSARGEAGRPPGRTADQVRVRDQPHDREGARLTVPDTLLARADEVIE